MNLLSENESKGIGLRQKLHEFGLEKLLKTGPRFATEFRSIMASSPNFKHKLESAIKNQRSSHQTRSLNADHGGHMKSGSERRCEMPPVIKLKTDFSNFK